MAWLDRVISFYGGGGRYWAQSGEGGLGKSTWGGASKMVTLFFDSKC